MTVRLASKDQRERATAELLSILAEYPGGVRTSDLRGTPLFHGTCTLSNAQIIRLLRESDKAEQYCGGQGARTFSLWRLK
jgi:hypothetical protein